MSTNVYIDGFNLYYGAVRNTSYKWLDIGVLCTILFPGHQIKRIRYFTAFVQGWPHDPDAPVRQNIYLRALKTIPICTIHRGQFKTRPTMIPQFPLAYVNTSNPPQRPPVSVNVAKTEEKGSDVNLATLLLLDCFDKDFDEAVVISNDSDLALPIEMVSRHFGKPVHVVNPHPAEKRSGKLNRVATSHIRTINKSVLRSAQFPSTLADAKGTFTKPTSW